MQPRRCCKAIAPQVSGNVDIQCSPTLVRQPDLIKRMVQPSCVAAVSQYHSVWDTT